VFVTHSARQITELLNAHGLRPSRALGQNFVADANTVRRIVRLAGVQDGDRVIEIGPGLGSLTLALVEAGARVTAVELDKHIVPVLRDVLIDTSAEVVHADAMDVDWDDIVPRTERAVVVANLPYNVGTHIVTRLLERAPQVERIVVMLQREVGERLVANVGGDAYGALSVKVRYYAEPKMLGFVPPTVFVPKPDVESAIVELRRLPKPPTNADPTVLFDLVRAGFAQRRKMLRRSLSSNVAAQAFDCASIEPTARAEELDVVAWGRLADCVSS
jgi:16S rRNA (adenine1518-N6/adenine1519-N6)-dimethyltransferase